MTAHKSQAWDRRYRQGKTGWDIGYPSPPIKNYIDQLNDKELKILIPGTGNSYEAEYLFKKGFSQVDVADISKYPLKNFLGRVPKFPENQLINKDFYDLSGSYDLIIEQTFFCAQDPALRKKYVTKMHDLLLPGGKLVGLLFDFPLTEEGPPFGGSEKEYRNLFSPPFQIVVLEPARHSIAPRAGNELFIKMIKET